MSFDEQKQLSRSLIAVNPHRNGNKGTITTMLLDDYKELTRQPWLVQLVAAIRSGKDPKQVEMLKKQLPFRSPHYFHFLDDHRAQKSIDPESFTFQTTIDIDNPEEVEHAIKYALLLNGVFDGPEEMLFRTKIYKPEDIETWRGKVLHVERSARNKAHIDIRIPVGMTIQEAQSAFCKLIRATEDTSCITPERIIFITDATSEIYVADDWYKRLPEEEIAEQSKYEQTFEGVPYEEIVKALVELMGGAPAHGSRNTFIYREACLLRYICNSEPAWIKQVIETFGEDQQKAFATVESACKQNQTAQMPEVVKQAIALARKRYLAQQATEKAGIYSDVPPELPAKLPKLVKLLTSKVPADFKPAVAMAVFPPLAAHLKGVSFRYIDNQRHEAAIMNLLVAPMSSGKSLVNGPIDCITKDMAQLDEVSRQKEQDWKDEVNTLGDNKKKPVRPEGIYIRIVSPDLTRAAYIQRMDEAQKAGDAYLYCKMDEVDMLKKFNDPSQLIRLCWDNAEDGQERVGSKSVTARVKTRFNWNASSTIAVTQKFFSLQAVADGAVSRLCLSTIIRPDFAPRPVVGEYDEQFRSALRPYIDYLNGAHGMVDCKKARLLAERLEAQIMETAQLADNKPYAEFAKRALADGYRKAMVLYLANGEKWEKAIEGFVEWSVKYDLWCKMRFFGQQMQEAIDSDHRMVCRTGPTNLLVFVPDTFTQMDIQQVYLLQGKKGNLSALLNMWQKRGHIQKNMDGTYSKTEAFVLKYGHYGAPVAA